MNRNCLSCVLMITTFVVILIASASPADAQLFRRWRAARQPAASSQYQQQRNQAYQQERLQRYQQQPSSSRFRPNTQPGVPSANYPRVPTLADQPKKVNDNLDLPEKGEDDSSERSQDGGLGQSILSLEASVGKELKNTGQSETETKETARLAAATMGLEIFQYSTPQNGVRIARINEKSKADESGIRVGDLIVAVDRTRTRSAKDLASILKAHQPGSSLRVQFVRGTTSYVTNVPLIASEFPGDLASARASQQPSQRPTRTDDGEPVPEDRVTVAKPPTKATQAEPTGVKLGMLIQDPASLRGTVVTKVRPGSIADASGLKAGDRIVSVESKLLASGNQLREIMSELAWGDQLAIGIVRDGELISRKVTLARATDKKLAASKPTTNSQQEPTSSLSKGLGSMLGGLLSGGSQAKSLASDAGGKVVKAGGAVPELGEPVANTDDPLGFGDDEPIEQVIFQKKTTDR